MKLNILKEEFKTREVLRIYFAALVLGFLTNAIIEAARGEWMVILEDYDGSVSFEFIAAIFSFVGFFCTFIKSDKTLMYLLLVLGIVQIPLMSSSSFYIIHLNNLVPNLLYLFLPSLMLAHQLGVMRRFKRHQTLGVLILLLAGGEFYGSHSFLNYLADFLYLWIPVSRATDLVPFLYLLVGFFILYNKKIGFSIAAVLVSFNALAVSYALELKHFVIGDLLSTFFYENIFKIGFYLFLFPAAILLFLLIQEDDIKNEVKVDTELLDSDFINE